MVGDRQNVHQLAELGCDQSDNLKAEAILYSYITEQKERRAWIRPHIHPGLITGFLCKRLWLHRWPLQMLWVLLAPKEPLGFPGQTCLGQTVRMWEWQKCTARRTYVTKLWSSTFFDSVTHRY